MIITPFKYSDNVTSSSVYSVVPAPFTRQLNLLPLNTSDSTTAY